MESRELAQPAQLAPLAQRPIRSPIALWALRFSKHFARIGLLLIFCGSLVGCFGQFHVAPQLSNQALSNGTSSCVQTGTCNNPLPSPTATPPATPPASPTATPRPSTPVPVPPPTATPDGSVNCFAPTPPQLTAAQRGSVKFYPGHYVAMAPGTNRVATLKDALAEIASNDEIKGVQIRYYWSDLHGPGANEFNFDQIHEDLKLVSAARKKLSVMIMWKFTNRTGDSPVPSFIDALTRDYYQYALGGEGTGVHARGFVAAWDNPVVVNEFVRFLARLSNEFDRHPDVSNIVFPETAMGTTLEDLVPKPTADEVSEIKDGFIDGALQYNQRASCLFKQTPVIQLTNSPIRRLNEMTNIYLKWTIGMGGPDVWMNDASLERPDDSWPRRAYDYYPALEPYLPIGVIIATGNYLYANHDPETIKDELVRERYTMENLWGWTPQKITYELGMKAINQLKANYIFWKRDSSGNKYYQAFLEHARKIGTPQQTLPRTHRDCPQNYKGLCR